jgi:predicted permease
LDIIEKIVLSLGIIVLGLSLGRIINWMCQREIWLGSKAAIEKSINWMTKIALLFLNPLVLIGVFWIVDIRQTSLFYLPILGILCLVLGGLFAVGFSKALKLDRMRTGSMFTSGTFYNWGSFGMLFCFMLLGQQSLVFVTMFRLLEELIYYTVGFPIAKAYGINDQGDRNQRLARFRIFADPFILTALSAILIGGSLNLSSLGRPGFYEMLINIAVPLSILLLVIPVGYHMRFMALQDYLRESFSISIVKFIMVPICIVPIAYVLGFGNLYDGMLLKTILIMSAMPPAFMSLIPPKLYGLDVNLANSSWLINTGLLVLVLPVLYVIIQFM